MFDVVTASIPPYSMLQLPMRNSFDADRVRPRYAERDTRELISKLSIFSMSHRLT